MRKRFVAGLLFLMAGTILIQCQKSTNPAATSQPATISILVDLAAANAFGFNVSRVDVAISNGAYADSLTVSVADSAQSATASFSGVLPGSYTVTIKMLETDLIIARGQGAITVGEGEKVALNVFIVSWDAAELPTPNSFLGRVRAKTGINFDLPTEAQWEYACRAGTATSYYNGTNCISGATVDTIADPGLDSIAWYGHFWPGELSGIGTREVGTKSPNTFGLYDMLGNVWEFCLDWYAVYPTSSVIDPVGPASGINRIARGGSWHTWPAMTRAAQRQYAKAGRMAGFRIACPAAPADSGCGYMTIDVTGGINAVTYPVAYLQDKPLDLLTTASYKTSKIVLRRISAGTFNMGSPAAEIGRDTVKLETLHPVSLSKDYFMGVFEITQGQWDKVMPSNPCYYHGAALPVENIDWDKDVRGGAWPPESLVPQPLAKAGGVYSCSIRICK
jgi:formylglycine-generating enzyme required for sulfatase activity